MFPLGTGVVPMSSYVHSLRRRPMKQLVFLRSRLTEIATAVLCWPSSVLLAVVAVAVVTATVTKRTKCFLPSRKSSTAPATGREIFCSVPAVLPWALMTMSTLRARTAATPFRFPRCPYVRESLRTALMPILLSPRVASKRSQSNSSRSASLHNLSAPASELYVGEMI